VGVVSDVPSGVAPPSDPVLQAAEMSQHRSTNALSRQMASTYSASWLRSWQLAQGLPAGLGAASWPAGAASWPGGCQLA